MPDTNDLRAALHKVRDAAKDVVKPGGWESGPALDDAIGQHLGTISHEYGFGQAHLRALLGAVQNKCKAWQGARKQEASAPGLDDLRLAAHEDAEDIVARCDSILAAL